MADRMATCELCGVTFPAPGARGRLPKRCPDCHRSYWNDWQREKKRRVNHRPCRVAKCVDCGCFLAIITRPGHLPKRCRRCFMQRETERAEKWRSEYPEQVRQARRRFEDRNPGKVRANAENQRARRLAAPRFKVTPKEVARMLAGPCAYCGAPAEHIDHVLPISRGGRHSIGNLVGACAACNLSKSNKLLIEWRKEQRPMLYRARRPSSIWVESLHRTVELDPSTVIDDEDPEGAAIVAEWGHRGVLRSDTRVEEATAAPGEQRTTRREVA